MIVSTTAQRIMTLRPMTAAVIVIADLVRERQTATRDALYAVVHADLTAKELDSCLRTLERAELITLGDDGTVRWSGPEPSDPAGDLLLGQGRN